MSFMTFPKTHIGLHTTNLDAAIAFYTDLLGTAPAKTRAGYAKFLLNAPPLNLALTGRAGAAVLQSEPLIHPGGTTPIATAAGGIGAEVRMP